MHPYYITTSDNPCSLYPLKDGRFQIIKKGNLTAFMSGFDYLLIEKTLANFLENLEIETASFKEAIIFDNKNNKEHHTHKVVIINQHFTSEDINDINIDGHRLLLMSNQFVFVSPSLKIELENSQFNIFNFSEGLSEFAA